MPKPTERQAAELKRRVPILRERYGIEDMTEWRDGWPWMTRYQEEVRPGRGHDLTTMFWNGEKMVVMDMDVYGYGDDTVTSTEVIHYSGDAIECDCEYCVAEAAEVERETFVGV